jgi:hypothetical protein
MQETVNFASVGGRVTDSTGGIVESASVIAQHTETNAKSEAVTDRD